MHRSVAAGSWGLVCAGTLGALVCALGCGLVLGIEDKETRAADASTSGESCLNGVDDDGDGALDCADSDCTAFMCAPPVPADWLGPVIVHPGSVDQPCLAGELEVLQGDTGAATIPPAECAPCACEAPDPPCLVTLEFHQSSGSCTSPASSLGPFDGCEPATQTAMAAKVIESSLTSPCLPSGGQAQAPLPPVTFDDSARLCRGVTGAGCVDDRECIRRPTEPFVGPCVHRPGDVACPADYAQKTVVRTTQWDGRSCTPCRCSSIGACTTGDVRLWDEHACSGTLLAEVPLDGTCATFGLFVQVLSADIDAQAGCSPTGGEGTTDVIFESETVCCVAPGSA